MTNFEYYYKNNTVPSAEKFGASDSREGQDSSTFELHTPSILSMYRGTGLTGSPEIVVFPQITVDLKYKAEYSSE
eukprot:SAG11_NODE_14593_length_606_cov_2.810651_1_plen_75_part_00